MNFSRTSAFKSKKDFACVIKVHNWGWLKGEGDYCGWTWDNQVSPQSAMGRFSWWPQGSCYEQSMMVMTWSLAAESSPCHRLPRKCDSILKTQETTLTAHRGHSEAYLFLLESSHEDGAGPWFSLVDLWTQLRPCGCLICKRWERTNPCCFKLLGW